jgi:hypothetical protein
LADLEVNVVKNAFFIIRHSGDLEFQMTELRKIKPLIIGKNSQISLSLPYMIAPAQRGYCLFMQERLKIK